MTTILTINPGSTSTKVALFQDEKLLFQKTIRHSVDDLMFYTTIVSQYEFRKDLIIGTLEEEGIAIKKLDIVMGRGGLTYPLKSGVYKVDDRMLTHVRKGVLGQHASNLGPILADAIAKEGGKAEAYIADPVVTDELEPVARISGHKRFQRQSIFHALNQKAVARLYARSVSKKYNDINLVVAHLGGGISVGAHRKGRVVDVNNALDGEGPFSPERSGTLPIGKLAELCFSGNFTLQEVKKMFTGEGGMVSLLGTNNLFEIEEKAIDGEPEYSLVLEAMNYQIAKAIGEMATVLKGDVEAILLTGGIANSKIIVDDIIERVKFIAPVIVHPGEDEMAAMALNAMLVAKGELIPEKYPH